jgi:hypothetical protein
MSLHHITLASHGRRTIAPTEDLVRAGVLRLSSQVGPHLLLFCLVDDHVHLVVEHSRPGLLGRGLARSLAGLFKGVTFQSAHVVAVESRAHLERLCLYVVRQPSKHGLPGPPALWSGSCFLDLAGLRLLPRYDPRLLSQALPRMRLRRLLPEVGLPPHPLHLATPVDLRRAGPARLGAVAAAVLAAQTNLESRRPSAVDARALAVQASLKAGFPPAAATRALGVPPRSARRLAHRALHPEAMACLRRRLQLEDQLRTPTGHISRLSD